jgi:hypothetical protein
MYKFLPTVLFILLFHCVNGQVEIPDGKYPYHSFIEWPGQGGLFINSDPAEKARDFNITFVSKDESVQWQETIYPKTFNTTCIVSKTSNYIYFFDQLKIEKNKLYYHQINSNGSVKSTSVDFLRDLKQLGYYNPDEAVVQNIINTEKALVFQLLLENRDDKVYDHVLIFLTHHNHRIYSTKMTPTNFNNFKADYTGVPYFAGSAGGQIYFAQISNAGNSPKVTFFPFDEKGVSSNSATFSIPDYSPLETSFSTYIPDGYNKDQKLPYYSQKLGFAFFTKGEFYFSQINSKENNLIIMRYTESGELETVYSSPSFSPEKKRYTSEMSLYHNEIEWVLFSTVADKSITVCIEGEKITTLPIESNPNEAPKFNHTQLYQTEHSDKHLLKTNRGVLFLPRKELPKKEGLTLKSL